MRVLFVSFFLPGPPNNGYKTRLLCSLKALSREHEVVLVSHIGSPEEEENVLNLQGVCSQVYTCLVPPAPPVWTWFVDLFSAQPHRVKRNYSPELQALVEKVLAGPRVDVAFAEDMAMAQYLLSAVGIRKVLTEYNVAFRGLTMYSKVARPSDPWLMRILYRSATRFVTLPKLRRYELSLCQRFDMVVACSLEDHATLQTYLPDSRIEVIPNGVDTAYFRPSDRAMERSRLVFTGTMNYAPNVDAVLHFAADILPLIKKQLSDVEVLIVGNDPVPEITQLAEQRGIVVTGYVEDVRPYLASASVVVIPIRIGSGTRLKVLEAMAMGKPIVSTSIGCEGIAGLASSQNILIADNPADFADNVVELLGDPLQCVRIGVNARRLVEKRYDWEVIGDKLRELTSNLLEQNARRNRPRDLNVSSQAEREQ